MIHLMGRAFMAMSEGILTKEHEQILYKMCLDNIPKGRHLSIEVLAGNTMVTTAALAVELGYDSDTAKEWLQELNVLGICDRKKGVGRLADSWILKFEFVKLLEVFQGIKQSDEEKTLDEDLSLDEMNAEWDNI